LHILILSHTEQNLQNCVYSSSAWLSALKEQRENQVIDGQELKAKNLLSIHYTVYVLKIFENRLLCHWAQHLTKCLQKYFGRWQLSKTAVILLPLG